MKPFLTMSLLTASLLPGLVQAQNKTINTVTFTGTLTSAAAPVVTTSSTTTATTTKTTQSLTSFRFSNREILQLMVSNGIIPTINGYSLIQKFQNDGTPIGYFVRSTTGAEVAADPAIFGFTTVGSTLTTNTTVTQPTTPGSTATTTGTIAGKVLGVLNSGDTNCTLLDTITRNLGRTARFNNANVRFTAVTSQGKMLGSFGANGPVIDATIDSKTTRPVSDP